MEYDINRPWLTLDDWQKKYIETEGNCFLLCGRQCGKTTAASIKIAECALREKAPCDYLVIALTERQAYNLFFKCLMYLQARYPHMIKTGKDKPTMHEINLKNGVCIMCYACGEAGLGLRTYTLKKIFIDEAAPMAREVFISVSPMLSVTGGTMDLLSTPRGKEGYFYEASLRDDFTKFYVSAEECPRHKKEFLESEKKVMSKLEYAQEYLAVFLDELKRVFSDELIKKCCTLKRRSGIERTYKYYMGIDLARMGEDESSFEILKKIDRDTIVQVENIFTRKTLTTETFQRIIDLEKIYPFGRESIGIDAGAGTLGVAILDFCLNEPALKRKVVPINNRDRPYDKDDQHRAKILKEDLYNNLLALMEQGKIKLLDDEELKLSLASVQYGYVTKANTPTKLRIFGNYTHIAEGLIRAAWLASKDKVLNIWVRY